LLTATLDDNGQGELSYSHNLSSLLAAATPHTPQILTPGIHAVSNSVLDTPWPKLQQARQQFAVALQQLPNTTAFTQAALTLLTDRQRAIDRDLPSTGVSLEWERVLSSIFVHSPEYGTRASTVLWIDRQGRASFLEIGFGPGGKRLTERCFTLPFHS
jgi:uncharacterized protein with NRDE domain